MKPCFSKLSVFVLSAIALTACGGGGGSGSHDDSNDRDESLYLAFHVLDGDIENAWVYADLNRNYQWDSEKEPRASTDSGGLVTLDISKKELNETGDTRLLIIASAGSTATDHVYGSEIALTSPLTMSRNIFVNRKTPDGTAFIISPFSTLADITAGTGSNYDSRDSYRNLMGTYAEQTGAVRSIVYQDAGYNKDCTSADDVKTLIAGELLTRKGLLPGTDQDLKNLIQKYAASSGFGEALASNKALTDYVYSLVMAEISENGQITRSREEISAVITGYLKNIPDLPADDDSGKTDDDSGKTDDDSGKTDDDSGKTDDDSGKTDDDSGKTDDDSGKTDDDSGKTDDDSGKTDDDSGKTDDDSGKTDDEARPTMTPARLMMIPARPTMTPARPMTIPARPTMTPARPMMIPARPMTIPARPTMTPARPTMTPARLMMIPARPTMTPARPTMTPARPTMTPARLMMIPETMKIPRPRNQPMWK